MCNSLSLTISDELVSGGDHRTKKLGIVVKVLSLLLVPIPLLLWPCVVVICSLLGGLGYGFGQPLVATFEAVGENRNAKFHHSLTVCDVTTIFMSSMMFLYVCLCITIDVRHGWVPCQVGVHFLPLVLQFFRKSSVLCWKMQDGTYNTLKGSCTVVRDFTDFTFHSYFDLIDEFRTGELKGAKPFDIK